jgi:hypothetical protein
MSSTSYSKPATIERHNYSLGWIVIIAVGAALASPLVAQVKAVLSSPRVVDKTIIIPRADFGLERVKGSCYANGV